VQLGGVPVEKTEKPQFGRSKALGILAADVILLLAFGSVMAMVLPIVTAVVAGELVVPAVARAGRARFPGRGPSRAAGPRRQPSRPVAGNLLAGYSVSLRV
jgi:hypothetical protein